VQKKGRKVEKSLKKLVTALQKEDSPFRRTDKVDVLYTLLSLQVS
jgi:hypothetical protein